MQPLVLPNNYSIPSVSSAPRDEDHVLYSFLKSFKNTLLELIFSWLNLAQGLKSQKRWKTLDFFTANCYLALTNQPTRTMLYNTDSVA